MAADLSVTASNKGGSTFEKALLFWRGCEGQNLDPRPLMHVRAELIRYIVHLL